MMELYNLLYNALSYQKFYKTKRNKEVTLTMQEIESTETF